MLHVNVCIPYEAVDRNADEFSPPLYVIRQINNENSDCHIIVAGDFVLSCRDPMCRLSVGLFDSFYVRVSTMTAI